MPDRSIDPLLVTVEFAVEGVFVLTGRIADRGQRGPAALFTVRSDVPSVLRATRTSAEVFAASNKRHGEIKDFSGQFELTMPTFSLAGADRQLGELGHELYQQLLLSSARGLEPLPDDATMGRSIDRLTS